MLKLAHRKITKKFLELVEPQIQPDPPLKFLFGKNSKVTITNNDNVGRLGQKIVENDAYDKGIEFDDKKYLRPKEFNVTTKPAAFNFNPIPIPNVPPAP